MAQKITPVHSFDVYGVLLDQNLMGVQIIDLFREVARGNLSDEEITRRVADYDALLKKKPEALREKSRILNEVYNYTLRKGAVVDPSKALYDDTIDTLAAILDQEQQVIILGSQVFDITCLPGEISSRMLGAYSGPKNIPETFRSVAKQIGRSYELVSHSDDGLIELRAAAEAGLKRGNLIYVARGNSSIDGALKEGFQVARELSLSRYMP